LEGNYPGLSSTYFLDGGGGRHSPNNNRSFDAPQMSYDSHGNLIDGPLPTDRPHTGKAFGYYRLKWFHQETLFGLSQSIFSGTPLSTCVPTGTSQSSCQFVEGQGNWVNYHANADGTIVQDSITHGRRTSAFSQTDATISHEIKVSKSNEQMRLVFAANVTNLLNQRAELSIYNSPLATGVVTPSTTSNPTGYDFMAMMSGWDYLSYANDRTVVPTTPGHYKYAGPNRNGAPDTLAARYGQPNILQNSRAIRLQVKFTF
jgi:hypothetical protein